MHAFTYSATLRPYPGEEVCGDSAVVVVRDGWVIAALSDGLGHGPRAHATGQKIEACIQDAEAGDMVNLVEAMHTALQGTVGAAIGLCIIRRADMTLDYIGIGNITGFVFGRTRRELISRPGTLGLAIRTIRVQTERLQGGEVILLHSDGISSTRSARDFPDLLAGDPQDASREIVRRFGKKHDDVSCLVLKCEDRPNH